MSLHSLAWLVIYVATALRFFIGDILHLEEADLTTPEAEVKWFWDFSFIIAECLILIFAGTVTSIYIDTHVSFVDYLLVLYAVDIIWLSSFPLFHALGQPHRFPKLFGRMVRRKHISFLELGWIFINATLAFILWVLGLIWHQHSASNRTLVGLLVANIVAFCFDVFLSVRDRETVTDSPSPYGS